MKCPECNALITKSNIGIYINPDENSIDIEIVCDNCVKEFFTQILPENLIPVE